MIAVVYLEKVVFEAHDINSAFSVSNFTSKHPQNNEQGRASSRRKGGPCECRTSDQMGTREHCECQNYYRFILYVLPWGAPHIEWFWTQEGMMGKNSSHASIGATQLGKKGLKKDDWKMPKWRARGENSQISWVLFRSSTVSGGLRGGRRAVHVPHAHARLQWVGCTLHSPHGMFLQGTGVAWEKSSGDDLGQLMVYQLHSPL